MSYVETLRPFHIWDGNTYRLRSLTCSMCGWASDITLCSESFLRSGPLCNVCGSQLLADVERIEHEQPLTGACCGGCQSGCKYVPPERVPA